MKYPTATGTRVLRAYNRAVKPILKERLVASEHDAGFIMPAGWDKGEGYQVFVRMERFSEALLKRHPLTGGLVTNDYPRSHLILSQQWRPVQPGARGRKTGA